MYITVRDNSAPIPNDLSDSERNIRTNNRRNIFDSSYALADLNAAYTAIQTDLSNQPFMTDKRQKIDEELVELHGIHHASSSDVQNKMETAMLSGILWTTLAVTLVYFAFRKL